MGITKYRPCLLTVGCSLMLIGCGEGRTVSQAESVTGSTPATQSSTTATTSGSSSTKPPQSASATEEAPMEFKPLNLNALGGTSSSSGSGSSTQSTEQKIQSVIAKLQPLQILLGQWRGTTRREFENFKAVDAHEWVWDLRTKPDQPALVMKSDKSPYIRSARLTWDVDGSKFQMTIQDGEDMERVLTGDFTEPVSEIVGSDDKLHRIFRLEFNEGEDSTNSEMWQLAFAQQENNRYLLEVGKRRGKAAFARFDTVSTQRDGTSFAISDSGYAEKTCIISEGLGTTEVMYKGRSYWVCCSGCKAAFEDDPETWIARAAGKDSTKK